VPAKFLEIGDSPIPVAAPLRERLDQPNDLSRGGLPINAIVARLEWYQARIATVSQASNIDPIDREAIVTNLRRLRKPGFNGICKGVHPLGRYAETVV